MAVSADVGISRKSCRVLRRFCRLDRAGLHSGSRWCRRPTGFDSMETEIGSPDATTKFAEALPSKCHHRGWTAHYGEPDGPKFMRIGLDRLRANKFVPFQARKICDPTAALNVEKLMSVTADRPLCHQSAVAAYACNTSCSVTRANSW